jgi:membrane-bound lytic murein transglycosylase D
VKPLPGESLTALADRVKVPLSRLVKYNDIEVSHVLKTSNFYFIEKKKRKAEQTAYTARTGDQWWSISQQFGIELKKLQKYNGNRSTLLTGDVVWLASVKSQGEAESVVELQNAEFNWGTSPGSSSSEKSSGKATEKVLEQSSQNEINDIQNEGDQKTGLVHEVKSSDTLFSVARQYNVTIKDLMTWNNKTDFGLAVGEKLTVKGK